MARQTASERKSEDARERLLDAVGDLAAIGWDAARIRDELEHALDVAVDDGLLGGGR